MDLGTFGEKEQQNGTLLHMLRNVGISDVGEYVQQYKQTSRESRDEQYFEEVNHQQHQNPIVGSFSHESEKDDSSPSSGSRFGNHLSNAKKVYGMISKKSNDGKSGSDGGNALSNAKQMYQLYKTFDKNGDGKITVEDVQLLLQEIGFGFVSKHLAKALFDLVDLNRNGVLDFHDLIALTSILKKVLNSKGSRT
ncbi:unnamed protein product [Didymodactylos carnosus]|uniref:EF-hand domain-containing protein n=1 Tax=Didymodactylos carnosus TaxID=1234261 RepID=A0A815DIM8_9BILA|nr:unnamed protein product [Didymodactylos carnosus]CAF4117584.1 unnamed protein product [Didymodactylos carnosus]